MYLSLVYRGPGLCALMNGTRQVGWLDGHSLRFEPFATASDATRAHAVGRAVIAEWLASRLSLVHSADATAGAGRHRPASSSVMRVERRRSDLLAPSASARGADASVYAVEFELPPGTYPSVALQPAQRIHDALRDADRVDGMDASEVQPTAAPDDGALVAR